MSKPKHSRTLSDHEAQAILSNVRTSPRKLNLVAAMIRNLPAQRAIATLTFSKRRIAHQVRKTLESAIANAENNHQLDVDRLIVTRAEVGRSIVMRRFHARGRGRSARIEKWFSHMKIVVAELQDPVTGDERTDVIEGRAIPVPAVRAAAVVEADHALTDATLSVPATEGTEAEAAQQAMPDEQAGIDHAASGERVHGSGSGETTDHAHTDATLSVPATEGTEAEAAQQAMSDDQAGIADHAAPGEHSPGAGPATMTDHAHTDPTLAIPATEGTEAEAAQQAMSDDQAHASDQAHTSDHTASDQAEDGEHHTPPDHSGPSAT
jgi:large subunit ribosomal protein L22